MKSKHVLKPGEKILFTVFAAFFVLAAIGYVILETVRSHSAGPMFVSRSSFDFSSEGLHGSLLYRESGCAACHRALREGTNTGLSLDGIGSRRSLAWIEAFLSDPEATYKTTTVDHGFGKEAGYVESMPKKDLHTIAIFLSQLEAEQGSAMARLPPPESSGFIDSMVKLWAPESWKRKYTDIRTESNRESNQAEGSERHE